MKLVLSIPTYWGRAGAAQPGDAVYDHPTPMGSEGTLGRALRSISVLGRPDVEVAIVIAPTASDLADAAAESVQRIVAGVGLPNPVVLVTERSVSALRAALEAEGRADLAPLLSLHGYASVRNAQLVAARLLDADAVVLIDDDEVFEDPRFLERVEDNLRAGVQGFAGYYIDAQDSYLLQPPREEWDEVWGKRQAMNLALDRLLGRPPDIKPTSMAFGGNMIVGRPMYQDIPFDPRITRGEDIDYVLNARLGGHAFHMDRTLAIRHLPPPSSHPRWTQLRQDLLRFVYERDKLRGSGLHAEDLAPYPGAFLGDGLLTRARDATELLARQYEREGNTHAADRTRQTWEVVSRSRHPRAFEAFLALRRDWQELMRRGDVLRRGQGAISSQVTTR